MHDYLAILFLNRQELVAGTFSQRLRRLIRLVRVLGLGRKRNRRYYGDARLDTRLAERWKQSDFVNGVESDAVGYVPQKSFSGLDHARTLEV